VTTARRRSAREIERARGKRASAELLRRLHTHHTPTGQAKKNPATAHDGRPGQQEMHNASEYKTTKQ
jgi:hypothetical protein